MKAFAFVNARSRSATVSAGFGVDRSRWQVVSVSLDSPFRNDGHAGVAHLLNDNPDFYWHTYHTDKTRSAAPHEVVLDMGRRMEVAAFTFLPRGAQSGAEGTPDQCEFHLSPDGASWTLAASCRFENLQSDPGMRLVSLGRPVAGRYLRFVARHVLNGVDYVAVAGLGVMEASR